jgi:hypothetical protein
VALAALVRARATPSAGPAQSKRDALLAARDGLKQQHAADEARVETQIK